MTCELQPVAAAAESAGEPLAPLRGAYAVTGAVFEPPYAPPDARHAPSFSRKVPPAFGLAPQKHPSRARGCQPQVRYRVRDRRGFRWQRVLENEFRRDTERQGAVVQRDEQVAFVS